MRESQSGLALQLERLVRQTGFLCLQLLLYSRWLWLAMALCCSAQQLSRTRRSQVVSQV